MSWGRVDDTYWKHDKSKALLALRDVGLRAAGAYWFLNSYCNGQHSSSFTIWEAAMVLRCSQDDVREIIAPLLLAPAGFERGFLLPKHVGSIDESYDINSFSDHRSKNEAKVLAGSQGGKKKQENRKVKTDTTASRQPSRFVADPKQPTTTPLPPDPDPSLSLRSRDPLTNPSPGDEMDLASPPGTITKLHELEQRGFNQFGVLAGPAAVKLRSALPISEQEFSDAAKAGGSAWGYLAKVLATMREQATTAPIPAMRVENTNPRRDPNRPSREQCEHWKSQGPGMIAIKLDEEDLLRELAPTDAEIQRHSHDLVMDCIPRNGVPRWSALVELIRAERAKPSLRIVDGAGQ